MKFKNFEYEIKDGYVNIISYTGNDSKVKIPKRINKHDVYSISSLAFLDLENLEILTIPSSVGKIEHDAFTACPNLCEIHLDFVENFSRDAFCDCKNHMRFVTKSKEMAERLDEILKSASIVCEEDFKIEVIDKVNKECKITKVDFRSDSLYIPDEIKGYKVTKLSFNLYYSTPKGALENVRLPKYLKEIPSDFFSGKNIRRVELPENLEVISRSLFEDCRVLTNIEIPKNVKRIEERAFSSSICQTEIIIPDKVEYIGEKAFAYCTSIEKLEVPNSVKHIGYGAFSNCISLTDIHLPKDVDIIEPELFFGCKNLKKVSIPEGVTEILGYAFENCVRLENIDIPKTVTFIDEGAFGRCQSLEKITIPDSVTVIKDDAFSGCTSLTDIFYGGSAEDETGTCWGATKARIL